MKHLWIAVCLFLSAPAFGGGVELAVFAGTPNTEMSFVKGTLAELWEFVPGRNLQDYTTAIHYFAERNGVQSVAAVQVLSDQGSGTWNDTYRALAALSPRAKVVLIPFGPHPEEFCTELAVRPATVFLVPNSSDVRAHAPGSCLARNILFVGALNAALDDLAPNETPSPLLRVAAPYVNLEAPVTPDRRLRYSSRAFGMGMIAGKMATLIRTNPELAGAALVDAFLSANTVRLPGLEGKVEGGRALLDVNY